MSGPPRPGGDARPKLSAAAPEFRFSAAASEWRPPGAGAYGAMPYGGGMYGAPVYGAPMYGGYPGMPGAYPGACQLE